MSQFGFINDSRFFLFIFIVDVDSSITDDYLFNLLLYKLSNFICINNNNNNIISDFVPINTGPQIGIKPIRMPTFFAFSPITQFWLYVHITCTFVSARRSGCNIFIFVTSVTATAVTYERNNKVLLSFIADCN